MQTETKKLLLDVLDACEAIQEFTNGKTFADYMNECLLRAGTEQQFEIIGEALNRRRRQDAGIATEITSLEQIIDFRIRIIHGYDSVDHIIVWPTVEDDLPILQDASTIRKTGRVSGYGCKHPYLDIDGIALK